MPVNKETLNAALRAPIQMNSQTKQLEFSPTFIRFLNDMIADRSIAAGQKQPVTIDSGEITVNRNFAYYQISVETGSTDDLDTINGGNEGFIYVFEAASSSATVVFKDGTGNIRTNGSVDLSLDNTDDLIIAIYNGTIWKCDLWNIGT